jgi:hypothetical protein
MVAPGQPPEDSKMAKILSGLVVVIAVFLVVVAMQPKDFSVERSAQMMAPAPVVYAQISDFRNWPDWSPWEGRDPAMEKKLSGAPQGTGAVYEWTSAKQEVGTGRMSITDAKEPEHVDIKLEFLKPFEATNVVVFKLTPTATGTTVSWKMSGERNFLMKAFSLFNDMDKMVGGDFEQGLTKLAAVSDSKAKLAAQQAATPEPAEAAATPTPATP